MTLWFAPGNLTVPRAEVDLRPGGAYLIHMHSPESNTDHIVSGEYEEVIPDRKLVFNRMWKDGLERTQVTVELRATTANATLVDPHPPRIQPPGVRRQTQRRLAGLPDEPHRTLQIHWKIARRRK